MPTYDYECGACKKTFEIFHSMSETRKKCPKCGALSLTRLFGPGSGFLFKGSGFYITDYRSADYTSKAKADSEKQPSGSGSDKGGADKSSSKESPKTPAKESPKETVNESPKGKKAGAAKD